MSKDKESYFKKALKWAKKKGLQNLKANYKDYSSPAQYSKKEEEKPYIPDITGQTTLGKKYYAEIALKSENNRRAVSKWKLMSTLADMKGGKLFLLAPRGHKAFVERMLERYEIPNAQLVALK